MGGGSKKPKQRVADYLLSMHYGVCYAADAIKRIRVNEKDAWNGRITSNTTVSINNPDLFGGPKKDGGVRGLVEFLFGGETQVLPDRLVAKLGLPADAVPGFRGVTSLFFTGGGAESAAGFMWGSNNPYLKAVDVTVQRAPKGFYPAKAMIPDGTDVQRTISLTREYSAPTTAPRFRQAHAYYIGPGQVVFAVPFWDNSYPETAQLGLLTVTPSGSNITLRTVSGRSGPPFGSSDRLGGFWYSVYGVLLDTPQPIFGIKGWFQQRADYVIAHDQNLGKIYLASASGADYPERPGDLIAKYTISDILSVALDYTSSAVPQAIAVSPGKIWIFDTELNLLDSFSVTIPWGAGTDNIRSWVDGDKLYVGDWEGGAVCCIDLTLRALVWSSTIPTLPVAGYYDGDFRVFGNTLIRAWANAGNEIPTAYVQEFTINPPVYKRLDANPAHIIYECLTDNDWGLGLSPDLIDQASFTAAADTLYAEGLGLSMMWAEQSTIEEFVNDVLNHIDGTYGIDPATGKIYLSLVRGDYDVDDLFELTTDNCRVTRYQRKSLSETVNEIVVTWTNPENEKEETVTVQDLANYAQQGVINSGSGNYYGVRKADLATRLALRDLNRSGYPIASFELEVDRTGWLFKAGQVVKLTYPEYGIAGLPIRISSVDYGRPGASKIQVSALEDVFSTPDSAYVDVSGSLAENPVGWTPHPLDYFMGASAPYYFISREQGSAVASAMDVTSAYAALLGASSGISSIDVAVAATNALGSIYYETKGSVDPSTRATLSTALSVEAISSGVALANYVGSRTPQPGMFVWIGSGTPSTSELAVVVSVATTITLRRGVLDTVPRAWPAGTQVWLLDPDSDVTDPDIRLAGQNAQYKLIPSSPNNRLNESWAPIYGVTLDNRQHRPYRPANVRINGDYWPTEALLPLVIGFSRRNRLTEEPVVRAWTDADVTPESGQTVTATLYRVDTGAILAQATGVTGATASLTSTYRGGVRLELKSVRDGLDSYQTFSHTFTLVDPVVERATESGDIRITESGDIRILE